jgi:hypothetical protein
MTHEPTKMLVEAGIIPKNTLQQLTNWRLVPEDYAGSHGIHPVRLDTSDPKEVNRFVKELGVAITKDMAEIRETELDRSGSYRKALLAFKDGHLDDYIGGKDGMLRKEVDVFVDRLGRVVTPAGEPWTQLEHVQLAGEPERKVVKHEQRYEGDKIVALVVYLEAKEGEPHA